jgi:hypothetical protein
MVRPVLLPHRRVMLGWGECQTEHRHVQQISHDHCHHRASILARIRFTGSKSTSSLTYGCSVSATAGESALGGCSCAGCYVGSIRLTESRALPKLLGIAAKLPTRLRILPRPGVRAQEATTPGESGDSHARRFDWHVGGKCRDAHRSERSTCKRQLFHERILRAHARPLHG